MGIRVPNVQHKRQTVPTQAGCEDLEDMDQGYTLTTYRYKV